jgi:hypothetical protein
MRPMRRRVARHLFTICSALSLGLCVGLFALSSRSWRVQETYERGRTEYTTRAGDFIVMHYSRIPPAQEVSAGSYSAIRMSDGNYEWAIIREMWVCHYSFGDLAWARFDSGKSSVVLPGKYTGWLLTVPIRYVAFLFAIAPAVWAFKLVQLICRRMRPIPGHCSACGYDLRASPERCPECGMFPSHTTPHS